jgi:hypothetical protein
MEVYRKVCASHYCYPTPTYSARKARFRRRTIFSHIKPRMIARFFPLGFKISVILVCCSSCIQRSMFHCRMAAERSPFTEEGLKRTVLIE